tara:strand:+ start:271 stop:645 length:375 start_codon:yes stop_codon:yes gene_type:complete
MKYYSVRIKLDDVIFDSDYEKLVFENLNRCKSFCGVYFQVIFWNRDVSEKKVSEFIKRNKDILFKINAKITKKINYSWFLIDPDGNDISRYRFKWNGDILTGLVRYIDLLKNAKGLMNESSNRR